MWMKGRKRIRNIHFNLINHFLDLDESRKVVFYSVELLENADNLICLTVLERKYIINKCIFLGVWSVKMKIELMYKETPYVNVRTVDLVWRVQGDRTKNALMKKDEAKWTYEAELESGEYYYKFRINNEFLLPDPMNNLFSFDENGNLWTLLIVGQDGIMQYNSNFTIHLSEYCLLPIVTGRNVIASKRYYNVDLARQIVARFRFDRITGIHMVTVVWCQPDKKMYSFSEHVLYEEEIKEEVTLWFELGLDEIRRKKILGIWYLKMFIDGEFILEDMFTIEKLRDRNSKNQYV